MITSIVSTDTYIPFTLLDAAGDPETGKVNADWTKTAYLASTPATTAVPTITEQASGRYVLSVTPTVVGVWHVAWSVVVDGETVRFEDVVQVVTAAQFDPVAALASSTVTVVSPVADDGDVTLYESDSYDHDESRALNWLTESESTWPTLTSAAIAFRATHTRTATRITAVGSVVTATGATKAVRVELAPADTNGKPPGEYDYQLIATLTNAHVVTLASGTLTLTERIRA